MKASKFSDAQKAFILKQGDDGVPVAEICRKAGISQATYFNWRKKYGKRCASPTSGPFASAISSVITDLSFRRRCGINKNLRLPASRGRHRSARRGNVCLLG